MINKINAINTLSFKRNDDQRGRILDSIHSYTKNSADLNDTIIVPRTIFKGYLGIMSGTTLVTLAGLLNKAKHPKMFKSLMGAGLLTSMYGTWAFVRPFVLKDKEPKSKDLDILTNIEDDQISTIKTQNEE